MKLLYLIGAYDTNKHSDKETNVRRARNEQAWVLKHTRNIIPICPHTLFLDECGRSRQYFLDATSEVMACCDAVWVINPEWIGDSKGSLAELELARELGLQVLSTEIDLIQFDTEEVRYAN